MRSATSHCVPIANTQDAGKKKVTGAGKEIERGENPEKVARIRAIAGVPRGRESARKEVDQGSTRFGPTVGMQGREVVAGEFGRNIAAQPGYVAVAEALMQQCGCGGDHSHGDNCLLVVVRAGQLKHEATTAISGESAASS